MQRYNAILVHKCNHKRVARGRHVGDIVDPYEIRTGRKVGPNVKALLIEPHRCWPFERG